MRNGDFVFHALPCASEAFAAGAAFACAVFTGAAFACAAGFDADAAAAGAAGLTTGFTTGSGIFVFRKLSVFFTSPGCV